MEIFLIGIKFLDNEKRIIVMYFLKFLVFIGFCLDDKRVFGIVIRKIIELFLGEKSSWFVLNNYKIDI